MPAVSTYFSPDVFVSIDPPPSVNVVEVDPFIPAASTKLSIS